MKIQHFIRLNASFILLFTNSIILLNAHYKFIIIPVLVTYGIVKWIDKMGFIAYYHFVILLSSCLIYLFYSEQNLYIFIRIIGCVVTVTLAFKMHLPVRYKIKRLLSSFDYDKPTSIDNHQITQEGIRVGHEMNFRQSEIKWLSHTILLKSRKLEQIEEVFIDNEIIGQNFQVNIR